MTTTATSPTVTQQQTSAPRKLWLGLILLLYLAVTLAYGFVNPLFEAPDAHLHYLITQYIADKGRLPVVGGADLYGEEINQEAAQPPLYYLLGAALIAPLDTADSHTQIWKNKYAAIGNAANPVNRNRLIHTSMENWPWQGYAQAAHLLRIFSTLLGMGTLLCIYGGGRLLWPQDSYKPLLAAGLVAFLPQFNFLHASISNDPLIIFLAALALWQLMRLWQVGVTNGRLLLLGITIGLAALAKNAGITLLIYAGGVVLLLALRERVGLRKFAAWIALLIVPVVALAGWLWLRNWGLYGDITATNQFIQIAGGDRGYTLGQVLAESSGLWVSLLAVFGWFTVRPPAWVYTFWNGIVFVALLGGLWGLLTGQWRQTARRPDKLVDLLTQAWVLPLLLAGWVIAVYASLLLFMLQTEAAQGRLLFPALLPLALGLAYGWTTTDWLRRFSQLLTPLAFVVTVYCLWFVIRPAFVLPAVVESLPPDALRIDSDMEQGLTLVGALVETETAVPGEVVTVTLYWRANQIPAAPPEQVISLFGRDVAEIGKTHTYHGRGMYPATLWPVGRLIADRTQIKIDAATDAPVLARITAGLADGARAAAGEVKINPHDWPEAEKPVLAKLGAAIELMDVLVEPQQAAAGETLELTVQWRTTAVPNGNYTTLLHLGQPDQPPLAVGDQPPLNGDYPTRVWGAGEVINDSYRLTLPEDLSNGRFPLWIGLYDSQSLERLPLTVNGEPQPTNVFLAGWIEIGE